MQGIVAQAFGLLGMAMNIASYQAKERRRVILIQLFGSTFFAINMLMLGAYSGFLLNAIGIARALVYARPAVMKRVKLWNAAFIALYVSLSRRKAHEPRRPRARRGVYQARH